MIIETAGRAILIAIAATLLIAALELGQYLNALSGFAWINVVIVLGVIATCVQHLIEMSGKLMSPARGAKPRDFIISGVAYAAFIYIIHQKPSTLGFSEWVWTYPSLEMGNAYHKLETLGPSLFSLWQFSVLLILPFIAIAMFALYIAIAETFGLATPYAWETRNQPEPGTSLHEQNADLTSRNNKLKAHNQELVAASEALISEVASITKSHDETVKTEQAIRQELVKASVVLERAQTKMADQDAQADEFKKCYIQLERQLNDSLDKIGKQDRYIALLLERQNAGQDISEKDQPKDEAGYTQFADNPFEALVKDES